jgi:predicted HicB family RNase H-like nuclease
MTQMTPTTSSQPQADTSPTRVAVNVPLPIELHRRLKIKAVTEDMSLRDAVIAAIECYVAPAEAMTK